MFISVNKTQTNFSSTANVHSNDTVSYSFSNLISYFLSFRKPISDNVHHDKQVQQLYNKVNDLANDKYHRRLFAVIQIGNEQRKVTTEDIICKVDEFHPTIGDRIRFEKVIFLISIKIKTLFHSETQVLLVGSSDFTVIGRPLLSPHFVRVEGIVIEKTLSQTQMDYWYAPKKKKVGQRQHRKYIDFILLHHNFFISSLSLA
jgi:large subunit ribosomal protein L21